MSILREYYFNAILSGKSKLNNPIYNLSVIIELTGMGRFITCEDPPIASIGRMYINSLLS